MARSAAGIRAVHDGLQPLDPLEPARHLASHLCRPRRVRRAAAGHADRQFCREGAPLGGWREKGGEGGACPKRSAVRAADAQPKSTRSATSKAARTRSC